jgi:type IV pilus assembly protein PilA
VSKWILFVVIASIVGILAVIGVPKYQASAASDEVIEALAQAAELQGLIQNYRKTVGRMPSDNHALGVPNSIMSNYVRRIEVREGAIHIELGNVVSDDIAGKVITMQPLMANGSKSSPISWRCGYRDIPDGMAAAGENRTNIDERFLPEACKRSVS